MKLSDDQVRAIIKKWLEPEHATYASLARAIEAEVLNINGLGGEFKDRRATPKTLKLTDQECSDLMRDAMTKKTGTRAQAIYIVRQVERLYGITKDEA